MVSCGAGTLEETGRGSRAAGDRETSSLVRGEPRAVRWASTCHIRRQTHKQNKKGARQALPKEGLT